MSPLAEALPDPSSYHAVGWVLAVLFALATGALVLKQLFQRDPPLHREFADRVSCEKIHGVLESRMGDFVDRDQYQRDRAEIMEELKRNAGARKTNYDRLEQLGREISATQAEVKKQGEAIADVGEVTRENSSKTDTVLGELKIINQQVQQIVVASFRK